MEKINENLLLEQYDENDYSIANILIFMTIPFLQKVGICAISAFAEISDTDRKTQNPVWKIYLSNFYPFNMENTLVFIPALLNLDADCIQR